MIPIDFTNDKNTIYIALFMQNLHMQDQNLHQR